MITLEAGPAEGSYAVKRAPLFLRAVMDKNTGKKDVLDQLEDIPNSNEDIHVYYRIGEARVVHLNMGRNRDTGFYAWGRYRYLEEANGKELRTTAAWRRWCYLMRAKTENGRE